MAEIDQALIDELWGRIRRFDSATAVAEAHRFAREQPAVLHFTREFLREFDEGTQGTALGFVYLLFRAIEMTQEASLPSLSLEEIERGYGKNTEWLDALERTAAASSERWRDRLPGSATALYILRARALSAEKGDVGERRRISHLLVLLKTFLDAVEGSIEGTEGVGSTESAESTEGSG
jgi:hypothetical protein